MRRRVMLACLLVAIGAAQCARAPIVVGSKKFTESVVLAELAVQLLRDDGRAVEHERALGGTEALWSALRAGRIDAYPEYTGTIRAEIFAGQRDRELSELLAEQGITMSAPLGFSNGYAIGLREDIAIAKGVRSLSDLATHREIVLALSPEFLERPDGWAGLRDAYGLRNDTLRLEHDMAYRALDRGAVAGLDLYATDAEIAQHKLLVLVDDKHHFPPYDAVFLVRRGADAAVQEAVARLAGTLPEARMIAMNARVLVDGAKEAQVAADFLSERLGVTAGRLPFLHRRVLVPFGAACLLLTAALVLRWQAKRRTRV